MCQLPNSQCSAASLQTLLPPLLPMKAPSRRNRYVHPSLQVTAYLFCYTILAKLYFYSIIYYVVDIYACTLFIFVMHCYIVAGFRSASFCKWDLQELGTWHFHCSERAAAATWQICWGSLYHPRLCWLPAPWPHPQSAGLRHICSVCLMHVMLCLSEI